MLAEREQFEFLKSVLGENEGIARISTKDKNMKLFTSLFKWPQEAKNMIDKINADDADGRDIYFTVALYEEQAREQRKYTKDLVKGQRAICIDFDGNAPQDESWYGEHGLPLPSLVVQTSEPGNQHVYWILNEFLTDIDTIENISRTITYSTEADPSGWDAGQLYRMPYTTNHKHGKPDSHPYDVFIEADNTDRVYPTSLFPTTKDFRPLMSTIIDTDNLPDILDVLSDNQFVDGFKENFKKFPEPLKRSDALMRVAYDAAESDLSAEEIYVLLVHADDRWGKYKHRKDKHLRYVDCIERAKAKYPHGPIEIGFEDETEVGYQRAYGFKEALESTQTISWVFEGLLSEGGYGILAGPPNIGKTQLAIRLAVSCALQRDFTNWTNCCDRPLKVMFYSLEMSLPALKYFLDTMTDLHEFADQLQENFIILPLADLVDFTKEDQRKQIGNDIETHRPDVIIIDSLSMAVSETLTKDETAFKLNRAFKAIRRKAKCAVISVHHSKKSQANKELSGDMDDLYGSRFITSEADFVITYAPVLDNLTDSKEVIAIRAINTKIRLGRWRPPVKLYRTDTLDFTVEEEPDVAFLRTSPGKHSAGSFEENILGVFDSD